MLYIIQASLNKKIINNVYISQSHITYKSISLGCLNKMKITIDTNHPDIFTNF